MKLHRTTSEAVVHALAEIFAEGRYADKVIEKVLKQNPRWGARDRRYIAETTYDIVRWYNLYRFVARAREDEYWKLLGTWCILKGIDLPGWNEFSGLDREQIKARFTDAQSRRSIRESIPDWMDTLGEEQLGERWEKELHALNQEAPVVLRANTLRISKDELLEKLAEENVATLPVPDYPDALQLEQRQNVFGIPSFREGLFEVQDAASQIIAYFLRVEPGLRVIDACAGAGGKTLHLAALMKNKGRIIAMDVEQWKLDELQKRARRAGVSNLEPRLIDSSKVIKRLEDQADRLLLDVPCSGMGVLKRNPDAKWKLSLEFIKEVQQTQAKIIGDYSRMLKPGGLMVYSTCSILPDENEKQVEQFLSSKDGKFSLIEERHVWPSEGFDGFYMALIKRNE